LEIGHVLFIDIVGYSKLLITEQSEQMQKLREIVRGTEQFRVAEKDVVSGAGPLETLARVAAQTGEPDRAIAALQQVLSIPGTGALERYTPLTPELLRLDPMFDPLRNDSRFQKLAAAPAPK
jgi:hypothetical protein